MALRTELNSPTVLLVQVLAQPISDGLQFFLYVSRPTSASMYLDMIEIEDAGYFLTDSSGWLFILALRASWSIVSISDREDI